MNEFMATIRLDNDGWRDPHDPDSLDFSAFADSLRKIADELDEYETSGRVIDSNGNTSGTWELRS